VAIKIVNSISIKSQAAMLIVIAALFSFAAFCSRVLHMLFIGVISRFAEYLPIRIIQQKCCQYV